MDDKERSLIAKAVNMPPMFALAAEAKRLLEAKEAELASLRNRVAELEEALKPFINLYEDDCAEDYETIVPDVKITVGDFRRAKAVYEGKE